MRAGWPTGDSVISVAGSVVEDNRAGRILRRGLSAVIALGLCGTTVELVLLEHYEEGLQTFPIVLMLLALAVLVVDAFAPSATTVRSLRIVMLALVAAGVAGIVFHFRGNMEFQLEMDATQSGWSLVRKVLHAKTPPALAPGSMAQLGLLGLLYTYRHPALAVPARSV
jgi:hypothetical protein